ncbi:GNAT family N-acetyltransferase [Archangium violaceum]|uniref:GNAT family N-acetyltransferase n=1 Tax=Archangium violaceum TaxID=83451 RepID=UPI00193C4FCD|nr:GNAT family N-acetyltransferase [Archangium violaceum]QRK11446.1 GNAT family N-acetyltransferase [Archangium violaceum]
MYELLVPHNPRIRVLLERLERLRGAADDFCFVDERDGQVVGTVLLHLCPDVMFEDRPYALLENLVVDPGARGRGSGRALLGQAERVCREHGCTKVVLLSGVHRTAAHTFFERLGYSGSVSRAFKKYLLR